LSYFPKVLEKGRKGTKDRPSLIASEVAIGLDMHVQSVMVKGRRCVTHLVFTLDLLVKQSYGCSFTRRLDPRLDGEARTNGMRPLVVFFLHDGLTDLDSLITPPAD
jgi:hypothetical protein